MPHVKEANEVFNEVFKKYKTRNNEKEKNQLLETAAEDFSLFRQLHYAFDCLEGLIKYLIIKNADDATYERLKGLTVRFPSNSDKLLDLYKAFPEVVDQIHDDLYEIINLENFELMLIYRRIPYTLFYSITGDDSRKIVFIREDIESMRIKSDYLVKKFLKEYIQSLVAAKPKSKTKKKQEPNNIVRSPEVCKPQETNSKKMI